MPVQPPNLWLAPFVASTGHWFLHLSHVSHAFLFCHSNFTLIVNAPFLTWSFTLVFCFGGIIHFNYMKEKLVQLRILIKGLILLITLYTLFRAWVNMSATIFQPLSNMVCKPNGDCLSPLVISNVSLRSCSLLQVEISLIYIEWTLQTVVGLNIDNSADTDWVQVYKWSSSGVNAHLMFINIPVAHAFR